MNQRGRTSGSFLIAVFAVVVGVAGYGAWTFLRPDPYALSERVVRDARRSLSSEVRQFQRGLDDVLRQARQAGTSPAEAIDRAAAKANAGIDTVLDDARDQLAELDIHLRTQRNRLTRIEARAQEARDMIAEQADGAKARAASN